MKVHAKHSVAAAGAEGLNDAMGVYYLKQGDYQTAVKAFGDTKTNNALLLLKSSLTTTARLKQL